MDKAEATAMLERCEGQFAAFLKKEGLEPEKLNSDLIGALHRTYCSGYVDGLVDGTSRNVDVAKALLQKALDKCLKG